jgi:transcriptional regulator with XRE-family HTH domain
MFHKAPHRRRTMDRLAELREKHALTLRELAEISGVAADTINQIELGHRKARPSTLRKLAKALDVEVRELFEEPALSGKAEGPLSPEWARKANHTLFRQRVREASTAHLQDLIPDLVGEYQRQTLEDLARTSPEKVHRRVVDFFLSGVICEELKRRGEKPPKQYPLELKRFQNAMSGEAGEVAWEDDQEHRVG